MKLYTEEQVREMIRYAIKDLDDGWEDSLIEDAVKDALLTELPASTMPWTYTDNGDTVDDFILDLMSISSNKRKLPLVTACPNGEEVYPSIKMGYENPLNMLVDDPSKMVITWRD
jgi:hypothetical protein